MFVFVGYMGSGKMMIVNLISCFYDVMGGIIKIDGILIKDFFFVSLCF